MNLPVLQGQDVWTHSRCSCWKQCPRKHHYQYERGIRTAETPEPLRVGDIWHKLLETSDTEYAIEHAKHPYEAAKILALYTCYRHYWVDDFDVISLEEQFEFEHEGIKFSGKIDGIIEHDGEVMLMEHKTCRNGTDFDDYFMRVGFDSQITHYMLGARSLGYNPTGILYNVAMKPGFMPKKVKGENRKETEVEYAERVMAEVKANPSRYFERRVLRVTEDDIARNLADMVNVARLAEAGYRFRNSSGCSAYGGCEYLHQCHHGFKDHMPEGFVQVDSVHQELK